jgi:restriction system protein
VEDSHRTTSGRTLFVIDGINEYVEHIGADLVRVARALAAEARVLVTSRTAVPAADLTLRLGVLSENASEELLAAYGLRGQDAAIFAKAFGGHPLAIELAASAVREGLFRPKELLAHLHEFHAPGIVGPGGIRVDADGPVPALQLQITDINEQLLRSLDTDITLARTLSPRKFEELVADLLVRLGYKVELTPAFRDGGKDIYAATRDDLGSFLYLVECKKYALANPVGVEVVRSLYGTVQAEQATAGILVTTSVFTKGARDFQRRVQNHLSLRDYAELHRWIRRVLRAGGADSAI